MAIAFLLEFDYGGHIHHGILKVENEDMFRASIF